MLKTGVVLQIRQSVFSWVNTDSFLKKGRGFGLLWFFTTPQASLLKVSAPRSTCFPVIIQPIALHKNKSYGKRRNGPPDGGIRQERPDPERFQCLQRHECP